MSQRGLFIRFFITGACGSILLFSPKLAARNSVATNDSRICLAEYRHAQLLEKAEHLRAAQEEYLKCTDNSCSSSLQRICGIRHTQLNGEIPSFVPVVTDATGKNYVLVEVKADDELLGSRLDGSALNLDPGKHTITFSTDDGVIATKSLIMIQGQRNRIVEVSYPLTSKAGLVVTAAASPAPAIVGADSLENGAPKTAEHEVPPPEVAAQETIKREEAAGLGGRAGDAPPTLVARPDSPGHSHALSYALAGTGVAGLAGFGLLTYWGRKDNDLLGGCTPNCAQSSEDHIKRLYLMADVSLGLGVAALVGAYWALAHARGESVKEESATEAAYMFGVQPTAAGAVGTVSGTF